MAILRSLHETLPPRVPEPVARAVADAYRQHRDHPAGSAEEIEQVLASFGRLVWPYRKAFEALIRVELAASEDAFLAQHVTGSMREHVVAYKKGGGMLADLHDAVRMRKVVPPEERGQLCMLLLDARVQAEANVRTQVAGDSAAYDRLVQQYQSVQYDVEEHLFALRRLAERVGEDTEMREHILEAVRTFELGFVYLAQEPNAREICAAVETFRERHEQHRKTRSSREARIFA